jgi:phenylpropionate dioxygenase-like ring-hydroxylating dioxygenase large terminal subunit
MKEEEARMVTTGTEGNGAGFTTASPQFDACRAELAEARHLPAFMYNAPEVFAREKELLFMRDWIVVAREDEIPNPGDYRALEFAGEPFVICRGKDGRLNAFVNSCRHRGAPVVSGQGNAKTFDCPWHAWSYDLEGKLISPHRPRQMGNFDAASCRMPPLKIDSFGGFVFVNFDQNADSLSTYLDVDGFRDAIGFVRSEDLMTIDAYTYDIDANWKIVMETLADVYHAEVVHKETFGNTNAGYKPQVSSNLRLTKYGSTKQYSSPTFTPGGEVFFGSMPWLADHPAGSTFALSFYLRPNFAFFARCDMIQPWVALPLTPTKTRISGWTSVPREFASRPDFAEKVEIINAFCRKVNDEDAALILALQKGTRSRFFPDGPMHELERLIHHRAQGYLKAMEGGGDAR